MKTKSTQKLITFPDNMLELLEKKASKFGLKSTEYVRYLVLEDIKHEYDHNALTQLAEEGKKEFLEGKTRVLQNEQDIENYVMNMV